MKKNPFLFFVGISFLLSVGVYAQFGGFDIGGIVKKATDDDEKSDDSGSVGKSGFTGFSLQDEKDVGGALAVELAARRGGILKDEALTKRVATIGKAIAEFTPRSSYLNYTFAVINSQVVNAYSAPGGYVFVTKGLVDRCTDDHLLAGVLAHEIAHVDGRHALKIIAGRNDAKTGSSVGGAVLGIAGSFSGVSELNLISGFSDVIGGFAESYIKNGYGSEKEIDADQEGTRFLQAAGFPVRSLRDFLAKLPEDSENEDNLHNSTKERVENLDRYINEELPKTL
jgi:predicted Zn-dependent protease